MIEYLRVFLAAKRLCEFVKKGESPPDWAIKNLVDAVDETKYDETTND